MTRNGYPVPRKGVGNNGPATQPQMDTESSSSVPTTNKSNEAAMLAQRLGSERSWANTYASPTPNTIMTPTASISGNEGYSGSQNVPLQESQDFLGPPPSYEESNSQPIHELPTNRPSEGSRQEPVRQSTPSFPRSTPEEEEIQSPARGSDPEAGLTTPLLLHDRQRSKSKRSSRCCKCAGACWLIFAVLICLCLMGTQVFNNAPSILPIMPGKPPHLPHRNYTRHETSQSIQGTFTFFDLLDLSTESGSISITLDPQPGDNPAVLRLNAKSGSIRVKLSDAYVAQISRKGSVQRPWYTSISSSSGSVTVFLPQFNGSTTDIDTGSATVEATLYTGPLEASTEASLSTATNSGTQKIFIKPVTDRLITTLSAKHLVKGSGTIKLQYPDVWRGMVHAWVGGSGTVAVQGKDLQYQQNGSRETYAWRGNGQSVEARCDGSGTVKVDMSSW